MSMKDCVSVIKSKIKNSVIFPSATKSQIDFANAMLKNMGLSPMPLDYMEFLQNTNGMIAPPFEFYGTENFKRDEYCYQFPNVAEANKVFVDNENTLITAKVVIGTVFFDIIVFDSNSNSYKLLNRLDFKEIKDFKNFSEILTYINE